MKGLESQLDGSRGVPDAHIEMLRRGSCHYSKKTKNASEKRT